MYLFDLKTAEPAHCYSALVSAPADKSSPQTPGLCQDCSHARRIESDRGSVFFLCQLALTDSRFRKYPRLPVISCIGYQQENGVKSVICKGNLLSETFVRLRALIDCGRHKGRRSVFHVQNLCSYLLIVPGTGRRHGGLQRGKCRGAGSGCRFCQSGGAGPANRGDRGRMLLGHPGGIPARERSNQRDLGIFWRRSEDGAI